MSRWVEGFKPWLMALRQIFFGLPSDVRLAFGAQTRNILGLVMKKGMSLVLLGIAIGQADSLALMRLLSSLLYRINATDFRTFGAIAVLLTAIALFACFVTARRATKLDPIFTLRYEESKRLQES